MSSCQLPTTQLRHFCFTHMSNLMSRSIKFIGDVIELKISGENKLKNDLYELVLFQNDVHDKNIDGNWAIINNSYTILISTYIYSNQLKN